MTSSAASLLRISPAYERSDWAATANLLARAASLLPPADQQRIAVLPPLAEALMELGRFDDGQTVVGEALEATINGLDPAKRVHALLVRADLASRKGASMAEMKPDVDAALAIAESTGDPAQLSSVHSELGRLARDVGWLGEARRELELALDAAQRSGDANREAEAREVLSTVMSWGTNLVADIDRMLADNLAWAREHGRRTMEAGTLSLQAVGAGRHGRIPEARRLSAESRAIREEIGAPLIVAATASNRGRIEFLAGDPTACERVLREGYEMLRVIGERGFLSTIAAELADALLDLGRIDEAEAMCAVAAEAGAEDDVATQVGVRLVRTRMLAARGRMDEALALVADGLARADHGEYYDIRATSLLVFAHLLLDAGRPNEARSRAQEVLDLARQCGDVIYGGRARDLMKETSVST